LHGWLTGSLFLYCIIPSREILIWHEHLAQLSDGRFIVAESLSELSIYVANRESLSFVSSSDLYVQFYRVLSYVMVGKYLDLPFFPRRLTENEIADVANNDLLMQFL
jgi:hypothetical protein